MGLAQWVRPDGLAVVDLSFCFTFVDLSLILMHLDCITFQTPQKAMLNKVQET